jgi:hypothetical protein
VDAIKADLLSLPLSYFVSKWVFERTPYLFNEDRELFLTWKHKLADSLGCDPTAMLLVGSSAVGVSLNPRKRLRELTDDSDVDVALVSEHHFAILWYWLRHLGARRYDFPHNVRSWIAEHKKRLVYWGLIATDQILPYTPLGSQWVKALADVSALAPVSGREVNIRVYRDFEALRAYAIDGLTDLRRTFSTEEA